MQPFITDILQALRHTFGSASQCINCDTISDSYRNYTARVVCSAYPFPLFFKLEKDFLYPRTQKSQIAREVAGLGLCTQNGIPVPQMIGSGKERYPWILEEFWSGAPLSSLNIPESNQTAIQKDFYNIFQKLSSIHSEHYGDTFHGGIIGKHSTWKSALVRMTQITFEDCQANELFGNQTAMIEDAIQKALSQVEDYSVSTLYHCDLFSPNIMGDTDAEGNVFLKGIIDFGMSLFAPYDYVQHMTTRYCDLFSQTNLVKETWPNETAYQILRIEPLLMMKLYRYQNASDEVKRYNEICSSFLKGMD